MVQAAPAEVNIKEYRLPVPNMEDPAMANIAAQEEFIRKLSRPNLAQRLHSLAPFRVG